MSPIGFSGDQHIGAGHITTLAEQEAALMALVKETVASGCRTVVLLGDATHNLRPSPEVLNIWGRALSLWQKASVRVIAIAGNHEGASVTNLLSYFRGSITAITEPTAAPIQLPEGIDLVALPWLPDSFVRAKAQGALTREEVAFRLTQAVRDILAGFRAQRRPGVPLVLATHATIGGAETSSGFSMGYRAGDHYLVPLEELEGFDFVAAGHIHRHQAIGQNGVYTGSLLPLDFSETEPKGVIVADIALQSRGMSAPVLGLTWRFIEIPGPAVRTFDVPDETTSIAQLVTDAANYVDRGDKIRIRVTCDETTAREYTPARIADALRAAGASLAQVELDVARPDRERQQAEDDLTPASALARYIVTREDLDSTGRDRVLVHGLSTIEELRASSGGDAGADLELAVIEAHDLMNVHEARLEFDGHGIYAITGPVATGKSTIGADALRVALFGASRYGAKVSDMLVRQGAEAASAAVELQGADGRRYRVVRKVKRTPKGATSTLDVLGMTSVESRAGLERELDHVEKWVPLSSGKIVDGQAVVDRILGGLTDETFGASCIVIQREADAFTRARPEERKQLLASAGGLSLFDELAAISQARLRDCERGLELLQAKADPLRVRATAIAPLEAELAAAEFDCGLAAQRVEALEQEREGKRLEFDRANGRADDFTRELDEAKALQRDLEAVDDELRQWGQKKLLADLVLTEKDAIAVARAELAGVRAHVVELEAQLVSDLAAVAARDLAVRQKEYREDRLHTLRSNRDQESRGFDHLISEARRRGALIDEAVCCSGEEACVFLADARTSLDSIPDLETKLAARAEPSEAETALLNELLALVIPEAPDPGVTRGRLTKARTRAVELERDVAGAEKIAKAEEILNQHDEAVAKLQVRATELATRKAAKNRLIVMFGPDPRAAAARARAEWEGAVAAANTAKLEESAARDRAGQLRGRIAAAREASMELEVLETTIAAAAGDVGALKVLVTAWRACRVNVLESSVIPSVEDTANEILRRFPYGLQILFATQRERRSGEGAAEALDVQVLGGRAPIYEGCSGGERTTIDFALHVGIALVVSRRASSRLRFLFVDEPEGLDEPGRAAFAAIARWIHETYGLTVLVASHASDLVDALGGQRIDVVLGPDGSTVQMAAA
jgi:exonuclease SbcD